MKSANRSSPVSDPDDALVWARYFSDILPPLVHEPVAWPGNMGVFVNILRDSGPDGHSGNKYRKWIGLNEHLKQGGIRAFACPGSLASYNLAALVSWAPAAGYAFTAVVKDTGLRPLYAVEQEFLNHQGKYEILLVARESWPDLAPIEAAWRANTPAGLWVPEGICLPVPPVIGACMAYGIRIGEISDWEELILDAGTGFTAWSIAAGLRYAGDQRNVRILPLMGKLRVTAAAFPVDWNGNLPIVEPIHRGYQTKATRLFQELWELEKGEILPPVYTAPIFAWLNTYIEKHTNPAGLMVIHSGG